MTALAILAFAMLTLITFFLTSWAIDMRLDAIRADLDRIETLLAMVADAVGVEDELEDAWREIPFLEPEEVEP